MGGARLTHELEQMEAALTDLAPIIARFVEELEDEGLARDEAVRCGVALIRELTRP